MSDLAEVEARHGFVFGTPDTHESQDASPAAVLVCTNPTCKNRKHHVQVHADTVLPVHCGACGRVLMEDPDAADDASLGALVPGVDLDMLAELVAQKLKQ